MRKIIIFIAVILSPGIASAHGFGGSGFLHPLTGLDHLIAMVAVGAWSAQLGERAIWRVPLAFLLLMCVGGIAGIYRLSVPFTEYGIAGSVILLGLAIAADRRYVLYLAVTAVGIFGFCHGFSHGAEIPGQAHKSLYIMGFLITTCGLHVAGATGGLLLMDDRSGQRALRLMGWAAAITGIVLFIRI